MSWLSRSPREVAAELCAAPLFPARVRLLAINLGVEVSDLDESDNTAMLALGGECAGYGLYISLLDDGRFVAMVASRAKWSGRVPNLASEVMQHLDRGSDEITFKVHTFDSGTSRCIARCAGKAELLTAERMSGPIAEMAGKIVAADGFLAERGLA